MPKSKMLGKKKSPKKARQPSGVRRKPGKRVKTRADIGDVKRSPIFTSAPAAQSMILPTSSFAIGGRAQAVADQDAGSSCRVTGTDLFTFGIKSGSGTLIPSKDGSPNTAAIAAGFSTASDGAYYVGLTPANVSPRLKALAGCFQWYIFRWIKILYIPGSSSASAASLALGFLSDASKVGDPTTPTQQQLLETRPSMLTSVWQPAGCVLTNHGTKLYETYDAASTDLISQFQGIFGCTLNGAAAATNYGQLYFQYIVDFYQPSPFSTSVSRALKVIRSHDPKLLREERKVADGDPIRIVCEDDDLSLSPPVFRPAPSIVPGTPGYVPVKIPSRK